MLLPMPPQQHHRAFFHFVLATSSTRRCRSESNLLRFLFDSLHFIFLFLLVCLLGCCAVNIIFFPCLFLLSSSAEIRETHDEEKKLSLISLSSVLCFSRMILYIFQLLIFFGLMVWAGELERVHISKNRVSFSFMCG